MEEDEAEDGILLINLGVLRRLLFCTFASVNVASYCFDSHNTDHLQVLRELDKSLLFLEVIPTSVLSLVN